jgi:hypothetical protein
MGNRQRRRQVEGGGGGHEMGIAARTGGGGPDRVGEAEAARVVKVENSEGGRDR